MTTPVRAKFKVRRPSFPLAVTNCNFVNWIPDEGAEPLR
jgi:hypothetical protein